MFHEAAQGGWVLAENVVPTVEAFVSGVCDADQRQLSRQMQMESGTNVCHRDTAFAPFAHQRSPARRGLAVASKFSEVEFNDEVTALPGLFLRMFAPVAFGGATDIVQHGVGYNQREPREMSAPDFPTTGSEQIVALADAEQRIAGKKSVDDLFSVGS